MKHRSIWTYQDLFLSHHLKLTMWGKSGKASASHRKSKTRIETGPSKRRAGTTGVLQLWTQWGLHMRILLIRMDIHVLPANTHSSIARQRPPRTSHYCCQTVHMVFCMWYYKKSLEDKLRCNIFVVSQAKGCVCQCKDFLHVISYWSLWPSRNISSQTSKTVVPVLAKVCFRTKK